MGLPELLRRGFAAGAAAGMAAAVVLYLLVEPVIRRALVVEEGREAPVENGGHAHEEALVSRTMQVVGGMGTSIVIGCLFGVIFAVVFARTRHRLPGATDAGRAHVLAGLGFLAFVLLPALKIPSNPPAVGDPETVSRRTLVYVLTILVAVALLLGVFALDRALAARGLASAQRSALVAVASATGGVLLLLVLPGTPDTIPGDVPADLIWDFRLASLAQLGAMWAVLGVVFGLLVSPRTRSRATENATVAA